VHSEEGAAWNYLEIHTWEVYETCTETRKEGGNYMSPREMIELIRLKHNIQ